MEQTCPNIVTCSLVTKKMNNLSETQREDYKIDYCLSISLTWQKCTRYIVKNAINFCPDFVLPDSDITPNEVIDKFDMEINKQ